MAFGFGFGLPMIGNPQWSPASLFYQSEPGAWYDPSDLSTLYQDAAGTTPVTAVEQSVGLMLDKSKQLALGSELVTNGDFSNGTTGWTPNSSTIAVVTGELEITATGSSGQSAVGLTFNVVSGRAYCVTGSMRSAATNSVAKSARVEVFLSVGPITQGRQEVNSNGVTKAVNYTFFATGTGTAYVVLSVASLGAWGAIGDKAYFDNISVRELPGNHAYTPSASATSRPVLSARYNLLTKTEQFDDAAWTAGKSAGASVSSNTTVAPNGTITADTVTFTTSLGFLYQALPNYPAATGNSVTVSIYAKTSTQIIVFGGASPAGTDVYAFTNVGNGWFKQTLTRIFTVTTSVSSLQVLPSGLFVGAGSFTIWGADLRVSNEPSTLPYQRVNTSTDYDTVGFPLYLKADGVDDYMQTNSIDFTATDKMTVWAGGRKLSDAAAGDIVGLSAAPGSNRGIFAISAPGANYSPTYGTYLDGSSGGYVNISAAAPVSSVLTTQMDISLSGITNEITMRLNGVSQTPESSGGTGAGTGNFGNYPLYLFRRGGSSLPFNGRFYGMTVLGAAATTNQIVQGETYLNQKMGLVY